MDPEACFTYVIYAPKFDKIYIGFSANPATRLIAHNHPKNKGYTKKFQPWVLIHIEKFHTKKEAMDREKQLKSHQGRNFIRELIRNSFNSEQ
jgi:putative endonuclease